MLIHFFISGELIHSVKFKDVVTNKLEDRRVLVVGIGNSAVDAAVNIAAIGRYTRREFYSQEVVNGA